MDLSSEKLLEFLKATVNCIDKKTTNWQVSGISNIEKYEAYEDILFNHYQYKNNIIKKYFLDIKCSENFVKGEILKPALNALKNEPNITTKLFNDRISDYIVKSVPKDDKEWYFVFPVNFRLNPRNERIKKRFKITDKKIDLFGYYNFVNTPFFSEEAQKELKDDFHDARNLSKYSWLIIKERGKDFEFALDQSVKILNKFLGVVNLSYWLYKSSGLGFRKYPKATGYTNVLSPVYVLKYNDIKKFEGLYHFDTGILAVDFVEFNDGTTKDYQRLLRNFKSLNKLNKKGELYPVIFESLEIYHLALNKIGYDSGFLSLWTGLEKMIFKRREKQNDLPHYMIINRIIGIMMEPPEVMEVRLREMLKKRHQLVHNGDYDIISLSDFNFLKFIYELVLTFLINHNNKFRSINEIEMIYNNGGKTKNQLKTEKKIINYLIRQK